MKTLTVNLPHHAYPIYIGHDLLSQADIFKQHIHGHQVLIVTQEKIAQFYLEPLQKRLIDFQCDVMVLPNGEEHKNISEWQKIFDVLLKKSHERSTTLIALGGGVVGDMTGFAAACYQRGVNYIQIPTSLIAQVDSAVGGKTAVNHPLGKNMLGAFYQPECVIVDIKTLQTLSQREFVSGLAEVIKYGLINDETFFSWLEKNITLVLNKDPAALEYVIERSLAIKAEIVSQDERDQGVRNLLNFGHTFGHALETACAYQGILHGEAVAEGMLMATKLSVLRGLIAAEEMERIKKLLAQCGLANLFPQTTADLLKYIKLDKKVSHGKMNFILLRRIGEAVKIEGIPEEQITAVLQ